MQIGRSRWKIENETGQPPRSIPSKIKAITASAVRFEHNYGHGKENLSTVLAYLMLLAFHTDQLIQRCHQPFQQIWKVAKTKLKIWQTLRALFLVKTFHSFQQLYEYIALLFKVQLE